MSPQKWEYLHVQVHNKKKHFRGEWHNTEEILAVLGAECWELVVVSSDHREEWEAFYFKRPMSS